MGRQACIVNWFCSSYLYMKTKKTILIDNTYFKKKLRMFNPSKFFLVTRFSVTTFKVLVTRYFVTLFSNTPLAANSLGIESDKRQ